jgi:hypothetical protein
VIGTQVPTPKPLLNSHIHPPSAVVGMPRKAGGCQVYLDIDGQIVGVLIFLYGASFSLDSRTPISPSNFYTLTLP